MSSTTKSICCAWLFFAVFFDVGQNNRGRTNLMSFAHRTRYYFERNFTPSLKKTDDFIGIVNTEENRIKRKKKYVYYRPENIYYDTNENYHVRNEFNNKPTTSTSKYKEEDQFKYKNYEKKTLNPLLDDENWPKFDDIMRLTNKYYDWKTDRWINYSKEKNNRHILQDHIKSKVTSKINQDFGKHEEFNIYNMRVWNFNDDNKKSNINSRNNNNLKHLKGNIRTLPVKRYKENESFKNASNVSLLKQIMRQKKFHFTRVRMNDTTHSRNIVVAVSVTSTLPKKSERTKQNQSTSKVKLMDTSKVKKKMDSKQ